MEKTSPESIIPFAVVIGLAVFIWLAGSFITYPPYARLGAFTFLVLGLGAVFLSRQDIEDETGESLEGQTGEDSESAGKPLGKTKTNQQKRKRKHPPVPKA